MKLMAIVGSPRREGNTDLLIDQVIAGCKSKTDVDVDKFLIVDKKIDYCTGCLTCCLPSPGTGKCIIEDDMAQILKDMEASDAFIFGTPNHMRTITAPMLNFLTRMLPLLEFRAVYDEKGNRVGGEILSRVGGKKAAVVLAQGEPYFTSALVYEVLERNLTDFKLRRIGDIISMDNLHKGDVAKKEEELKKAFELGAKLAS
jgi:multimeric flavodoxin WrbA